MVSGRAQEDRRRLLTLPWTQRENILDKARVYQTHETETLIEGTDTNDSG